MDVARLLNPKEIKISITPPCLSFATVNDMIAPTIVMTARIMNSIVNLGALWAR
jgi:hypothetical protein